MDQELDRMVKELTAAGWKRKFHWLWQSPTGKLYHGPAYAWKVMKGTATFSG